MTGTDTTRRQDDALIVALLATVDTAARQANDTHVSEGEARRWSPVVSAAEALREARQR